MVPTPRLWALFALGIPVAALAGWIGSPVLALAYNAVLIAVAVATSRLAPASALSVTRSFDPVLSVRVRNRIRLKVENTGAVPARFRLRDEPPIGCDAEANEAEFDVPAGAERQIDYWVTPHQRGSDFFRGTFLRLHCPLGLVQRQVRLRTEQPVRIYPNVLALREFDLLKQKGKLNQMGIRRARSRGLGTEFESLREYTQGDDYRKIDWKASARRGKLIVRQYEQERSQSVILAVDIGRLMLAEAEGVPKLDHVLNSLLMLAHAAAIAGDQVGLLVYSDVVHRYLPPGKGRGRLGTIIEATHNLLAEPVESDPVAAFAYLATRWKRRSLLVCFSDAADELDARTLATAIGPLSRRHLILAARVGDPKLRELTERPIATSDDLFRKAGALLVQEDRQKVPTALQATGIHSLEAEPEDLSAALVSFYFDVKERSLL